MSESKSVGCSISLPAHVWEWIDERVKEGKAKNRSEWILGLVVDFWKRAEPGEVAAQEQQLELRSKFNAFRFIGIAFQEHNRALQACAALPIGATEDEVRAVVAATPPSQEFVDSLAEVLAVEEKLVLPTLRHETGPMPTLPEWQEAEKRRLAAKAKPRARLTSGQRKLKGGAAVT